MRKKGTKGRRPRPYSRAGRRMAKAAAAKRAAPRDREAKSRAEAKREVSRRIAEAGSTQVAPPTRRRAKRLGPIEAEASGPRLPESVETPTRATPPDTGPVLPVIAITGRPNVGKSTLFNRLTRSRRALVGDEPGLTRDRIYGEMEWKGQAARLVDTGGILPEDPALIPAAIFRQARTAIEEATVIVMTIDGRTPLAAPDFDLARILFASGKPVLLALNKVDPGSAVNADAVAEAHRLGIGEIFPISAEHGAGIGELLDRIFELPEMERAATPARAEATADEETEETQEALQTNREAPHRTHGSYRQREVAVAIIGRPNTGKSTLLNALTRSSRAIVSPLPGTTRDAVDESIAYEDLRLRFIDTAGIRRKGKTREMAEKLSVVMARRHLETADVALLMIDATAGVTAADATIGGYAHESGRSVVLVVNKWDLAGADRADGRPPASKEIFERQLRATLKYLDYAPVVFLSAEKKTNLHTLLKLVREVALERRKRVTTGQMNRFLEQVDFERAGVPAAGKVRIFYMTQAAVAPPTFVLFTNRQVKLHFSFERFLVNQIRAAFGFRGSPIWLKVRARRTQPPHKTV